MESIFLYSDYKSYIKYRLNQTRRVRGSQKNLCDAAGIQASFLSRVLNKSLQLTPEHAASIGRYLGLSPLEAEYFLELVNHSRAGTQLLKKITEEKLSKIKEAGTQVSTRLSLPALEEEKVQAYYYSSWLVSAIHVLLSIDGFQTLPDISRRFSIHPDTAKAILTQLEAYGLVEEKKGHWRVGHSNIHLPRTSPFQGIHQSNWKSLATQDVYRGTESLHYCNVHSISFADFQLIKEELLGVISKASSVIKDSPPQKLGCINIDYFEP